MQKNRVWHHGRADDADCDGQCGAIRQHWGNETPCGRAPIYRCNQQLDKVAKPDDGDHRANDKLHRAKPVALENQNAVGDDRRHRHAPDERQGE